MYEYINVLRQVLVYSHTVIYKIFTRPTLSCGNESQTIGRAGERRLISAEMRFMRTVGCSFSDRRRKEEIMRDLRILR
jgi:hypothetical protein